MRALRSRTFTVAVAISLLASSNSFAQVVINEVVDDERTAGSGQVRPDTREFVELYNPTNNPVEIGGWTLNVIQLGPAPTTPTTVTYTIPVSQSIAAGDYYVIAKTGSTVPNVDLTVAPGFNGSTAAVLNELLPTDRETTTPTNPSTPTDNFILELRDGTTLVDALATETFRDPERDNLTPEQVAQVGGGWWAQTMSMNAASPNLRQSLARFHDGRDTNVNGRDFGILPLTPGASNNLPLNQSHTIPNVDSLPVETSLSDNYYSAFVLPRVVDPTVADGIVNPNAIPMASPQGGNAIMAYDESGGGDASFSKELVNSFDLYAYIDTAPLGLVTATDTEDSEATTYGIGSTDQFFGTPNQAGLLALTSTQNGNTGYGWMIQRVENFNNGSPATTTLLQFIDFNDGGDSLPADNEWKILATFELSSQPSAWHRLGVTYDPDTGEVQGRFDDQIITPPGLEGDFNNDGTVDAADYVVWRKTDGGTEGYDDWVENFGRTGGSLTPGLLGTFYVGYRENLDAEFATSRPPTFDMIGAPAGQLVAAVPEPGSLLFAAMGLIALVSTLRRRP